MILLKQRARPEVFVWLVAHLILLRSLIDRQDVDPVLFDRFSLSYGLVLGLIVLAGIGPLGTGMEETYQVTSALKHLPFGKHVALVTDGRFSGVSTGACIGHVGPEALAAVAPARFVLNASRFIRFN